MSASMRTKDGSFSPAAALIAHEQSRSNVVFIDLPGALAWAKENGLKLAANGDALTRINRRRGELRLPSFEIVPTKPQKLSRTLVQQGAAGKSEPQVVATTEDALLDLVSTHSGTVTGVVTPQLAGWLLDLNTGNRPMLKSNTERFRNILRDGRWQNTGEPIIVSREGVLNDGQHRLKAVLDTEIAVTMDLRFGIPREAFHATGTGKRRSPSNVLSIEGYANTSAQAAIARMLRCYDAGQMSQCRHRQIEAAEILAIVEKEELIGQIAGKIQRHKFGPARTGSFGFVLVVAARATPIDLVYEFGSAVAAGFTQDENDPARRLHIRLRDTAMRRERLHQLDFAVLAAKCWNAWLTRDEAFVLRIVDADRTNAGFPKIATGARASQNISI
jgi:hypothetical protein